MERPLFSSSQLVVPRASWHPVTKPSSRAVRGRQREQVRVHCAAPTTHQSQSLLDIPEAQPPFPGGREEARLFLWKKGVADC